MKKLIVSVLLMLLFLSACAGVPSSSCARDLRESGLSRNMASFLCDEVGF